MKLTRRDFIKASSAITGALALGGSGILPLRQAFALETANGGTPVIWFQGQACTGCSVSFLNSNYYGTVEDLLTKTLDLNYHPNVMAAAGKDAVNSVEDTYQKGGYVMVVEGAIPTGASGNYCTIWPGMTIANAVKRYASRAAFIVAAGACASYGGISHGAPNPTTSAGLAATYNGKRVVKLPGCPVNPDHMVGTIAYILKYGQAPALDSSGRPTDYYGQTVHSQCAYRGESDNPTGYLGRMGCLRGIGCKGPVTHCDCPTRRFNSPGAGQPGVNWCVYAGSPCIGCTEPTFPDKMSPFYKLKMPNGVPAGRGGDGSERSDD